MPMIMGRMPVSQTGRQRKRGFTLTEIAIVLGIIGLILGAIWVAASAVYQNLRISKATTELLTITQGVRTMYATSATVDANADMKGNFAVETNGGPSATYLAAGVFPTDTLDTGQPATAVQASDPWNGLISIVSAKALAAADSFAVQFDNVPSPACISMLVSNTGTGRDASLYGVGTAKANSDPIGSGKTAGTLTIPVAAAAAQALCAVNAGNPVSVGFQFKVKG